MKQKIGIIVIILLTSACGISTPQGYVLGTTGFLETSYRATQQRQAQAQQRNTESVEQKELILTNRGR